MDWCSYGGLDMFQEIFDYFQQLVIWEIGKCISMIIVLGVIESVVVIMIVYWLIIKMGSIGLLIFGMQLKLMFKDDKYELCVKGL